MRKIRKFVGLVLAAAMVAGMSAIPAMAAETISMPSSVVRYLSSADSSSMTYSTSLYISGVTKSTKISNVKSSNKNVAEVESLYRSTSNYSRTYYNGNKDYSDSSAYADLEVNLKKVGTAVVSAKVGGKTYKTDITVLAYKNPVKTLKLTGISSKNLKSSFAKSNSASRSGVTAKKGSLQVAAASGWKITSVEWYDSSNGQSYRFSSYGSKAVSSASLPVPAMKKANHYSVSVSFVNTKTNGSLSVYYNIG